MLGATDERSNRAERRVGRILGDKWRLDRLIGMGGMAAVYSATHTNNLRPAAIKVLHRELSAKDDIRKRFLREGYIANKVGHPGAVAVLDDGSDEDGSVFLVMELLQGETLHALAKAGDGTLPPLEVLRVVDSLLDVLAAAHEAGVIHRDLKPENVFVTREGDVKVLDFGIARLLEPKNDLTTQAGMLVGTPTFMPPEQVAGKMELIDGRTDLWAVGAMMFTLLSGKLVHEAKMGNALLLQAMTAPARKLVEVLPEIHPSVSAVVDRALAFDRDDRWPDARAMQVAVRDAIATGAARKGSPKTGLDFDRLAPTSQRGVGRRSFAALVALVLLAVTAGFGAWMRRRYAGAFSLGTASSGAPVPPELAALGGDGGEAPGAQTGIAGQGANGGAADLDAGADADVDDGGDAGDDDEDCDDAGDGGDCYDEEDDGGSDDEESDDGGPVTAPFVPPTPGAARGAKPGPAASHRAPVTTKKPPPVVRKPTTTTTKPRKPHRKKRRPRW